ncbi:MAG TPA: DUF6538 domain-containing protein [Nitrospiraceae bacterium]|nr:DUF6538 domain-containing protein [Nitrospiraceae bacterium]
MATVFHHLKRKTYYHRSIVPRRLQPYFKGREQLWRNLKTEDKDEAILKSAQWTARMQQLFLTLRKQGDHMTDEQREVLVSHWLERELDEAEDARTLAGPLSDSYREGVWHVFSDHMDDTHTKLWWRTIGGRTPARPHYQIWDTQAIYGELSTAARQRISPCMESVMLRCLAIGL